MAQTLGIPKSIFHEIVTNDLQTRKHHRLEKLHRGNALTYTAFFVNSYPSANDSSITLQSGRSSPDFFLFLSFKGPMKGRHFGTTGGIQALKDPSFKGYSGEGLP